MAVYAPKCTEICRGSCRGSFGEFPRATRRAGLKSGHPGKSTVAGVAARLRRETRTADSGKAIPQVYLVPVEEWDAWGAEACLGARWERADEAAIFARAQSLGWQAPQ
jgi:hypothetical protein